MDITIISDTHNRHKDLKIEPCDMLVHCGDFSIDGYYFETQDFVEWFAIQPATYKVFISGNHDLYTWEHLDSFKQWCKSLGLIYLHDSETTIEGLKLYGSPWVPSQRSKRWGYYLQRSRSSEIKGIWSNIPNDTDILITHIPPKGILDLTESPRPSEDTRLGCEWLLEKVLEVKPKLHLFGHIHEYSGSTNNKHTIFINAASMKGRDKEEDLRKPKKHRYFQGLSNGKDTSGNEWGSRFLCSSRING